MDEQMATIKVNTVVVQAGHEKGSDSINPAMALIMTAVFLTFLKKEGVGLLTLSIISLMSIRFVN